ncbi:MAG TPA: AAA family ATPase [Streptosporangiaceae bacterium]|nr:AAA family ATPase [Streptosporangiaceae bacterium]
MQSPVFVGRREEIASLTALLERAADGEPGFAIVAGEAGVGKTRLVTELAGQAAGSGFTVLAGHCVELGAEGLPLAPLIDALRTLARTTARTELADVLGPARRGLGRLLPELDPGGSAEPAADGVQVSQLLELVLGLLGRLSARRPLLLVLEDLHWSDQSTRELVAFLIRSLRGVRVVLLATYRSDELNRRHPLRPLIASWDRLRTVQHVELRRFEPGEVAAQLGAILGTEPAAGLVDLVFDRSGGNAYLVEELAGLVRGGGDPADLPPSWRTCCSAGWTRSARKRSGCWSRSAGATLIRPAGSPPAGWWTTAGRCPVDTSGRCCGWPLGPRRMAPPALVTGGKRSRTVPRAGTWSWRCSPRI